MADATVDEYIAANVTPELRPIVDWLRVTMRELAPKATEKVAYKMPTWVLRNIIVWVIPTEKHITLGFVRGAQFEDKYDLLRGKGKAGRNIKLKTPTTINKTQLRYYVRQAIALDKE